MLHSNFAMNNSRTFISTKQENMFKNFKKTDVFFIIFKQILFFNLDF